jgi:uncharacterized protein (DUF2336 family)
VNAPAALAATPLAKDTSAEPDDDPFWVRSKAYAKRHPALLTRTKLRHVTDDVDEWALVATGGLSSDRSWS